MTPRMKFILKYKDQDRVYVLSKTRYSTLIKQPWFSNVEWIDIITNREIQEYKEQLHEQL